MEREGHSNYSLFALITSRLPRVHIYILLGTEVVIKASPLRSKQQQTLLLLKAESQSKNKPDFYGQGASDPSL